ncbi:YpdA family putative bacillithiol disulfide reductase [Alkalihalobacterium chitinilyticum]|uniref:YpdA family putative bacillithiol disulfide reductase n=1 Tax=Alkalihalobacterium chitinilyticum TaxID=2980103 RepID=A0ABT5VBW8_9BACI|nr:YpdA family putative bacillithiol disulfide reductase [Alkalihalobacterium chitinilyticum]MDE5411958.1 YpdA family putative bacillithiol disulfide reductase [Alkalihalobacterium chitinilyticum]
MTQEEVIIVGGGPCGLAAAIALMNQGYSPLVIEKDNIVSSIYRYPTHQTFFSTSEKLEIGGVPFVTVERKPKRNQALSYYREVVKRKEIRINAYEQVTEVKKRNDGTFTVSTLKNNELPVEYHCKYVIVATGYYDHPNMMGVKGEDQSHVFHYFKEAHPYFDKDVVVIGGKNSAVDAALELERVGARVTVLYRGDEFSKSVKPWILPEFASLINNDLIQMVFKAEVIKIKKESVVYEVNGVKREEKADFVFAMTGYHPDHSFLHNMGVGTEKETGRPIFNEDTMETNVEGIFIAGVIAAGNNANEIFIENGRFHGGLIAAEIVKRDHSRK